MTDEFYVGYSAKLPSGIARTVRFAVGSLAVLAVVLALNLIFGQNAFTPSAFEFQQYREFGGYLELRPYPALLLSRPAGGFSRYLLVAPGKHGVTGLPPALDRAAVTLRGVLIYRNDQTMLELLPGSLRTPNAPALSPAPVRTDLGDVRLTGEIVDSKCYFGVMNPGGGKVHRDCAVRCISGGIPPALLSGGKVYLLAGSAGRRINRELLDLVGEPVEIAGRLFQSGETLVLETEPEAWRRAARE
jgi:hypothetical protein